MKVGELYWKGIMECTDPTVLGFSIMDLCQFLIIVFLSHMSCVGSTCVVLSLKESGRFSCKSHSKIQSPLIPPLVFWSVNFKHASW